MAALAANGSLARRPRTRTAAEARRGHGPASAAGGSLAPSRWKGTGGAQLPTGHVPRARAKNAPARGMDGVCPARRRGGAARTPPAAEGGGPRATALAANGSLARRPRTRTAAEARRGHEPASAAGGSLAPSRWKGTGGAQLRHGPVRGARPKDGPAPRMDGVCPARRRGGAARTPPAAEGGGPRTRALAARGSLARRPRTRRPSGSATGPRHRRRQPEVLWPPRAGQGREVPSSQPGMFRALGQKTPQRAEWTPPLSAGDRPGGGRPQATGVGYPPASGHRPGVGPRPARGVLFPCPQRNAAGPGRGRWRPHVLWSAARPVAPPAAERGGPRTWALGAPRSLVRRATGRPTGSGTRRAPDVGVGDPTFSGPPRDRSPERAAASARAAWVARRAVLV